MIHSHMWPSVSDSFLLMVCIPKMFHFWWHFTKFTLWLAMSKTLILWNSSRKLPVIEVASDGRFWILIQQNYAGFLLAFLVILFSVCLPLLLLLNNNWGIIISPIAIYITSSLVWAGSQPSFWSYWFYWCWGITKRFYLCATSYLHPRETMYLDKSSWRLGAGKDANFFDCIKTLFRAAKILAHVR